MKRDGGTSESELPAYRPLVPAVAAFAAGIVLREHSALPAGVVWAVALAGLLAYPLARWAGWRWAGLGALCVVTAAAGWVRLDLAAGRTPPHHIARLLGDEPKLVKLRGIVASEPEPRVLPGMPLSGDSRWLASEARQTRFDLECSAAYADGQWGSVCGRLRVVLHAEASGLRYGDEVVAVGMARLPAAPSNPGQVDGATLLRRRGIAATLSLGERCVAIERSGLGNPLLGFLYQARASLRRTLRDTLAPDREAGALLCALVLGDRTELDDSLEETFARTGTIHLLAVSGFNVGIVAWLVWVAAAFCGLGRRLSGTLVLCAVLAYALITGAPPSVVRAAVMCGAFVLTIMGRRRVDLIQTVALAAIVLLALRPFDLFNVGFQLSFAAVPAIVYLMDDLVAVLRPRETLLERLQKDQAVPWWRGARHWLRRKALSAIGVSTAAWLAVLPLTAYYFNLFSPITVLVNLPAAVLAAVLTVLGFLHLGLAELSSWAACVTAWPARGLSGALAEVVRAADQLPLAWTYCVSPALGWVFAYYAVGLLVVERRRVGLRGRRAAMLWMAGVLVYLLVGSPARTPKGLEVTALDVQHGNATVLRFPDGATVVYDCGSYGRNDVGRWVVAPALWHWGVQRIDLLVVSHADADHINGLPALLERFSIGGVVHSPVLEREEAGRQLVAMLDRRRIPRRVVRAGERVEVGEGNVLEVLWPMAWSLRLRPNDQNENSLVLRVEHAGRRVLLGGDIQQVGATALLHSGVDLRADVLLVPHHGCALANAEQFARAVRPAYALCSNRSDRLPPATVAAYEAASARVLATCWDGAITARIGDRGIRATVWRRRPSAGQAPPDP